MKNKIDKNIKILEIIFIASIVAIVIYFIIAINIKPQIKIDAPRKYNETITVYADKDYAPYSYIDEDGKEQGYDIELMYTLAEEMQVNVDLELINWNGNLTDMDFAKADVVTGLEYKEQHDNMFLLTTPVQASEYIAFGKNSYKEINELHTKKLGILEGSICYPLFIEQNDLQKNTREYDTYEEGFQDVVEGEIDYLLGRYHVGKVVLKEQGIKNIEPTGPILTNYSFCFGVNKNNPELLDKLNSALNSLNESGVMRDLSDKWLGHFVQMLSIKEFIRIYSLQIVVILGVLTFIWFLLINIRNKNRINIKHKNEILKKLQNQLETDTLTGGISKYKFDILAKEKLSQDNDEKYMLISIDVDNFKFINETYGYKIGNKVLVKLFQEFKRYFGEDSLITRVYGDNFLVITKYEKLDSLLKEKNKSYTILEDILGSDYKLSMSSGKYIIEDVTEDLEKMIDFANMAKKTIKNTYGNSFCVVDEEMKKSRQLSNEIVGEMELALQNKEFYMIYQPKISLKTGLCVGAEALVRWKTKDNKNHYPNEFIPIFEDNGFILQLDYYVVEEVCKFIANAKIELPVISINLSGKTLLNNTVVKDYYKIIEDYGIEQGKIEFEITESELLTSFDIVKKRVIEFKSLGFTVAIDDFGTGASSLNRIQGISVDCIKLDKGFIDNILNGKKGLSVVKGVLSIISELGTVSVAEGIETKEQLNILQELGCDVGQGYYFEKGISQDEFIDLVQGNKEYSL